MTNLLVMGAGILMTLFLGAAVMDAVFGQPRGSGGEFAPMRTTQLKNLVALAILSAILLYVVTYF